MYTCLVFLEECCRNSVEGSIPGLQIFIWPFPIPMRGCSRRCGCGGSKYLGRSNQSSLFPRGFPPGKCSICVFPEMLLLLGLSICYGWGSERSWTWTNLWKEICLWKVGEVVAFRLKRQVQNYSLRKRCQKLLFKDGQYSHRILDWLAVPYFSALFLRLLLKGHILQE